MEDSGVLFRTALIISLIILNACGAAALTFEDYDRCYNEAINQGQIAEKYFSNGQWDDAIEYYNKALQTFESCGDEYNQAVTLMKIGVVYAHKGELDTALGYLQDSQSIFLEDKEIDKNEIATMGNLGKVYALRGEWDEALELFNQTLSWSEEKNDTHGMALAIANIGGYYRERGNYSTAIEYHLQAADFFNKSGDLREAGGQLRNVGIAYYLSDDFENSIYYYDEAKYFFTTINDNESIDDLSYYKGLSYKSIAVYYKRIDDFNESLNYSALALSESIEAKKSDPNGFILGINSLLEMGDVYALQGLHENALDSYSQAKYFLEDYRKTSEILDEDFLNGTSIFISAKISFEKAIIQSEELNYEEAASVSTT